MIPPDFRCRNCTHPFAPPSEGFPLRCPECRAPGIISHPRPDVFYPAMARLALKHGLVSHKQFCDAFSGYRNALSTGSAIPFDAALSQTGRLEDAALFRLTAGTLRDVSRTFLDVAKEENAITPCACQQLLDAQARAYRKGLSLAIPELLVERGRLRPDAASALYGLMLDPEAGLSEGEKARHADRFKAIAARLCAADRELLSLAVSRRMLDKRQLQTLLLSWEGRCLPVCDLLLETGLLTPRHVDFLLTRLGGTATIARPYPGVRIEIRSNGMEAVLLSRSTGDPEALLAAARHQDIIHGLLSPEELARQLADSPDAPLVIATGTPPTPPIPGRIRFDFPAAYLAPGTLNADGTMDFLDRGAVPDVCRGQRLATRMPSTPGMDGRTVTGAPVPPPVADPPPLQAGPGVMPVPDGRHFHAAAPGFPELAPDGTLSVLPVFHLDHDVDIRSGHIHFDGRVVVGGALSPGFRITARSVEIDRVDRGEIHVDGHLVVHGGISGGRIRAGGNVTALFASDADITAMGEVEIQKAIMDSRIDAGERLSNPAGRVLASRLSAPVMHLHDVGNLRSRACQIRLGLPTAFADRKATMAARIAACQNRITNCEGEKTSLSGKTGSDRRHAGKPLLAALENRLLRLLAEQAALFRLLEAPRPRFALHLEGTATCGTRILTPSERIRIDTEARDLHLSETRPYRP